MPLMSSYLSLCLLFLHFAPGQSACDLSSAVANTKNGPVRGRFVRPGERPVVEFLGIPYAESPVGPLRFKNPTPLRTQWQKPIEATRYAPYCLQVNSKGGKLRKSSEDCLYLNIWSPADACSKTKHVMVYIHGGGMNKGSASDPDENGQVLAAFGDVVVVSMNYRLGFFGLLASQDSSNLNLAIKDQRLALQWVNQNIANFGGDPNALTIFGHSAGSLSVGIHLLSSDLTFVANGIMQSGTPYSSVIRPISLQQGYAKSVRMSKHFKCSSESDQVITQAAVECLQKVDAAQLIEYGGASRLHSTIFPSVVYGDSILPATAKKILSSNSIRGKPFIVGFEEDEANLFIYKQVPDNMKSKNDAMETFKRIFTGKLKENEIQFASQEYLKQATDATSMKKAILSAYGDLYAYCSKLFYSSGYKRASPSTNIYIYNLKYKSSKPKLRSCPGVCHGEEIPLVFGAPILRPDEHNKTDLKVSLFIIQVWSAFAKTGKVDYFRAFDPQNPAYSVIDDKLQLNLSNEKFFKCYTVWKTIFDAYE